MQQNRGYGFQRERNGSWSRHRQLNEFKKQREATATEFTQQRLLAHEWSAVLKLDSAAQTVQKSSSPTRSYPKAVNRPTVGAHKQAAVCDRQPVRPARDGGGPKRSAGGRIESGHLVIAAGE